MNISTKSWHYKLQNYTWSKVPNNLCPYFWKLIIAILLFPFTVIDSTICKLTETDRGAGFPILLFILMLLIVIHGTLLTLYHLITWNTYELFEFCFTNHLIKEDNFLEAYYMLAKMSGIVMFSVIVIPGIVLIIRNFYPYLISKSHKLNKNPSIITEFIKAKKGKYCPKITFTDHG